MPGLATRSAHRFPLNGRLSPYCEAAPDVYAAGDVARWHNPLFGTSMRIEHRTNAAEQGVAAARNLIHPGARKPFAPVPYFWSDQYDLKIQAYGHLRGDDEVAVVEGDLAARRFVAAYRTGDRVSGALAIGMAPQAIRRWRQAILTRTAWEEAVGGSPPKPRPPTPFPRLCAGHPHRRAQQA